MAKVRERYWIPRLRGLVKEVRKNCMGCCRFIARPFPPANHAPLPTDRTIAGEPYSVIGVDFTGPLRYHLPNKSEAKSYLVIYACSQTRDSFFYLFFHTKINAEEDLLNGSTCSHWVSSKHDELYATLKFAAGLSSNFR